MLPNWECDTDRAKGLAKLGLKSSAAAIIAAAYWALGPGAISISNKPPDETNRHEAIERKTKAGEGVAKVGLGSVQLPGPQVGAGKNNMNSGEEGHELYGSMDTHEEEGCRRLCSIEISA